MPLPQSGIELVAEGDQYLSTIDAAISRGDEFTATIDSQISSVNEFSDSLLAMESPDVEMPEVIPFDEVPPIEIDTQETEDAEESLGLLRLIAAHHVFQMILDIAGTALDFFNRIQEFTVAPILDVQDAVAKFNAQTGEAVEGLDAIINRLHFQDDVGDFNAITDTLIAARQFGIQGADALHEAALGALEFTKVFDDQNPVETLRTMNQLVTTGLARNFTEAADILTLGFQQGGNRAGDLLQTLNQFSPMFSEMGFDSRQTLSVLTSGLDAGFRSTQDVARAISTMNDNLVAAAGDMDAPINAALESIGVAVPAAGEDVGVDFFNAVIAGLQKHPDMADAAIADIFGTRTGRFSEAITELTTSDEVFEDFTNRASEAATEIDNSLRGAISDFILWIQGEINTFLSSAAVDLPGKLEELKSRLQDALAAIQSGAGFGEALEIALQVPGLNDTFHRIEGAFGNFEIVLLQVIAALADIIGQAQTAASARQEVARLGEQQLAFDLKLVTTPEELQAMVDTALSRGVTGAGLGEAFEIALTELAQSGDIEGFAALAHSIEQQSGVELTHTITDMLQDALDTALAESHLDVAQAILDQAELEGVGAEMRDTLVSGISEAMAAGNFEDALDIANMLGEENMITAVQEMAAAAGENFDAMAGSAEAAEQRIDDAVNRHSIVPDIMDIAEAARISLPEAASLFYMLESAAEDAMVGASGYVNVLVDAMLVGFGNVLPVLDGTIDKLTQIAQIGTTANQVVTAVNNSAAQTASITNNTTINMNQTNNVQSQAQSASVGAATSRQIRGLAA